jgi:regulator of sigma E protease
MTVVVAILGLILLIVVHELGHMLTAKALGVRVPEFGVGFGPPLFRKKIGTTVYSLRLILLGGFAKMAGMNDGERGPDTYPAKAPWRRALIIFAGPFANILAAVAILAVVLIVSGAVTGVKPVVRQVETGSMAARVGIHTGDRLVAIDGHRTESWQGFTQEVAKMRPGEDISLTVERGGAERTFTGELGADRADPHRALVGVRPEVVRTRYGPVEAVGLAVGQVVKVSGLLGSFVVDVLRGERSLYNNVTGPVGIASVGGASVAQGFFPQLLALISINLALFNLVPILPLDGGHLLFIGAEKMIGRPVSQETMGRVAALGIALVLMLFLFATYADLSKIFTGRPFIPQ